MNLHQRDREAATREVDSRLATSQPVVLMRPRISLSFPRIVIALVRRFLGVVRSRLGMRKLFIGPQPAF